MGKIREETGDIFASPRGSVLIHACNLQGTWGKGVALEFRNRVKHLLSTLTKSSKLDHQLICDQYIDAFKIYQDHCKHFLEHPEKSLESLVGTALIMTPNDPHCYRLRRQGIFIACLFTSRGYGRRRDSEHEILENTRLALNDLHRRIETIKEGEPVLVKYGNSEGRVLIGNCKAVKLNSGNFGIDWKKTKSVLEAGPLDIVVVSPDEGPAGPRPGNRESDDERGHSEVKKARKKDEGGNEKNTVDTQQGSLSKTSTRDQSSSGADSELFVSESKKESPRKGIMSKKSQPFESDEDWSSAPAPAPAPGTKKQERLSLVAEAALKRIPNSSASEAKKQSPQKGTKREESQAAESDHAEVANPRKRVEGGNKESTVDTHQGSSSKTLTRSRSSSRADDEPLASGSKKQSPHKGTKRKNSQPFESYSDWSQAQSPAPKPKKQKKKPASEDEEPKD
ncbi:ADP-ribose 1''-phosphate phosphatase [Lecanora helva]